MNDDDLDRSDASWDRELAFRKRRNEARDPRDPACENFGEGDDDALGDQPVFPVLARSNPEAFMDLFEGLDK